MLSLKKTAVAVLALSSSVAMAGTMGPVCTPGNVTVPCESTAWDLGIEALYLEPTYDADASYLGFNAVNQGNTQFIYYNEYDPKWDWGFRLEGSYHFGTGNDFTVNWTWYEAKHHQYNTLNNFGFNANLNTHNKVEWNQVNLEMGQHVDAGNVDFRFHGGLSFLSLKNSPYFYLNNPVGGNNWVTLAYDSKFSGVAPRIGLDSAYDFGNGFKVYGKGATALFVGDAKSNVVITATPNNPAGQAAAVLAAKKTSIVPQLEAKLGAQYTMAVSSGDVTFDVGYMWTNFFNAHHGPSPFTGFFAMAETDQGFHGLTFGAKWVGNVA